MLPAYRSVEPGEPSSEGACGGVAAASSARLRRALDTRRYVTAPAIATSRSAPTIHGHGSSESESSSVTGTAVSVALGDSTGADDAVALGVGVGVGVGVAV